MIFFENSHYFFEETRLKYLLFRQQVGTIVQEMAHAFNNKKYLFILAIPPAVYQVQLVTYNNYMQVIVQLSHMSISTAFIKFFIPIMMKFGYIVLVDL